MFHRLEPIASTIIKNRKMLFSVSLGCLFGIYQAYKMYRGSGVEDQDERYLSANIHSLNHSNASNTVVATASLENHAAQQQPIQDANNTLVVSEELAASRVVEKEDRSDDVNTESSQEFSLLSALPDEMVLHIAFFLELNSLLSLIRVSKPLRSKLSDDAIWEKHVYETFGNPPSINECLDLKENGKAFWMSSFFRKQGFVHALSQHPSLEDSDTGFRLETVGTFGKINGDYFNFMIIGAHADQLYRVWSKRETKDDNAGYLNAFDQMNPSDEMVIPVRQFNDCIRIEDQIKKNVPDMKCKIRTKNDQPKEYFSMARFFVHPDIYTLEMPSCSDLKIYKRGYVYINDNMQAFYIFMSLHDSACVEKSNNLLKHMVRFEQSNQEKPVCIIGFHESGSLIPCSFEKQERELKAFSEANNCRYISVDLRAPAISFQDILSEDVINTLKKSSTVTLFPM